MMLKPTMAPQGERELILIDPDFGVVILGRSSNYPQAQFYTGKERLFCDPYNSGHIYQVVRKKDLV